MNVLVTGVAGFIGSNLANELLLLNHKVIGIDNLSYGSLDNLNIITDKTNFEFILGDIANPLIIKDFHADVIVHLASQKIPRYSNALRTLDENYLMLKNVINKCIVDKSKIVFASTSDVYGKNPNIPFTEEHDLLLGPTKVKRWSYALSKIYGEHFIIANNDEYNLQYSIARFFGSYGRNQNLTWWGGPQSGFITNAFLNKPIDIHGNGMQTRTFSYIQDTINGLINLVLDNKANNEIFNIASNPNEEITILSLAELIWKLVNGEDSTPILNYIPYTSFGRYEDVMRRVPDITKIKKYFDFNPTFTLEEGLKETINWQLPILKN